MVNAARELGPNPAAATVRGQALEMQRQVDYILVRARVAAASHVLGATIAVDPLVHEIVSAMRTLHGPRGIGIEITHRADSRVAVEGEDLGEILGNLLDNACKWASARVEIACRIEKNAICVTIDGDGAGFPAANREAVFERGARLDETVPGHGMGLSIVRDLVAAYGGTVQLHPSPLGGLRAEVSLPMAAAARRSPTTVAETFGKPPRDSKASRRCW